MTPRRLLIADAPGVPIAEAGEHRVVQLPGGVVALEYHGAAGWVRIAWSSAADEHIWRRWVAA
jgi:hypothetical protein